MKISIFNVFLIIAALHGFAVLFFIFKKEKRNSLPAIFVSVLILLIIIQIVWYVFFLEGILSDFPHLRRISDPLWFLFGPVLFFYNKSIINQNHKFILRDTLHFSPFIIHVIVNLPYYLLSAQEKIGITSSRVFTVEFFVFLIIFYIQILFYLYRINLQLKNYIKEAKQQSANTEITSMEYLYSVLTAFAIYFMIDFSVAAIMFIQDTMWFIYGYISFLFLTTIIYIIGYNFFTNPENVIGVIREFKAYKKTNLGVIDIDNKLLQLNFLMVDKKLFLKTDLKLSDLALEIELSNHQLSELLNNKMNSSFYDFVNKYRVEEAKKKLLDPDFEKYTISSIALETGFNSSASFYRIFKKFENQSPNNWLKSQKAA